MKLGLGLSLPGVAAMQTASAQRLLHTAKHYYDARFGSAFTDYGTGGANGSATDVTHSGNWWAFNGSTSYADLWGVGSVPLNTSASATIYVVLRRSSASAPGALQAPFSYKDGSSNANVGVVLRVVTTTAELSAVVGDGTDNLARTTSGAPATDNTLRIVEIGFGPAEYSMYVGGTAAGATTRGVIDDATPAVRGARVGANASSVSNQYDGEIGAVAAFTRRLDATERASVLAHLAASFA